MGILIDSKFETFIAPKALSAEDVAAGKKLGPGRAKHGEFWIGVWNDDRAEYKKLALAGKPIPVRARASEYNERLNVDFQFAGTGRAEIPDVETMPTR